MGLSQDTREMIAVTGTVALAIIAILFVLTAGIGYWELQKTKLITEACGVDATAVILGH